jgi:hypothetical protein
VGPPKKQQLIVDLQTLEQKLEEQQMQLGDVQAALAALERQRAEIESAASSVRATITGIERDLAQRREALATAERAEAKQAFDAAVADRDGKAVRLAQSLTKALDALEELDAARGAAAEAHGRLQQLYGPRKAEPLPREPRQLTEPWERLLERMRTEVDVHLVDELVEAAARSPLGHAIDDLPAHLREAARQRRQVLLDGARGREHAKSDGASSPA